MPSGDSPGATCTHCGSDSRNMVESCSICASRKKAHILVKYDQTPMYLLRSWRQRIEEARATGITLDRLGLRIACLHGICIYGDGFLATSQLRDPQLWRCARKPFLDYRSYFLTMLDYAAGLEIAASTEPGENQEECLRYGALYLECAMLAVLKVQPDRLRGKEFQRRCLKQYRLLKDEQALERVQTMFDETLKNQEKQCKKQRQTGEGS